MTRDEWENILKLDGGRDFRKEQFKGASAVDDVCANADGNDPVSLLLEAPTGTGKTLMYLGALRTYYPDEASEASPSDDSEVKAVVSTSGKLLQHQIAESAKKLGMVPVVLMGRANYLCRTACLHYLDAMPEDHPLHGELDLLCQWLEPGAADSHEMREILKLEKWSGEFREFMRHHLTASSAYCRNGHDGNTQGNCYFSDLQAKAAENPLVILNHHALFSFGASDLFNGRVLIADEAHAMPEAASSVLTCSVSTRQLYALRARAEQCREACPDAVASFQRMLKLFETRLQNHAGDSIVVLPAEEWLRFCKINKSILKPEPFGNETIRKCDPFHAGILKELDDSWREIYDFVTALDPAESGKSVLYFETEADGEVSLKYAPIETAPLLENFWKQWSGTVGLSATLTLPGAKEGEEFDYFRKRCGFPKPTMRPLILDSPFDLAEQCGVFVPASGTEYDCPAEMDPEKFLKKRIELAGSMIRAFGGRTLALYTATGRLAAAAAVLKPLFPDKILAQGDGDNDALADEFVREKEKSLLGTRSFFQGFDAPGETLSCEILEKLPFRRRDDPVQEEQIRRAGPEWFSTVVLPAMLMELRQAFGRLIRSKDDHGIFILTTDRRFRTSSSRKDVEQALAGVPLREFTGPEDLLSQIPKGFLPFDLADISGFEERFSEEWNKFRETDLFRRITGLKCLADVLRKFKIEKLYDWQKTVIDNVLNGVPAQFVVQPPGGGKSLTYQIPAMMRPGLTLVISPLKALMQDQVLSLKKRGITGAEFYNSNLSPLTRREIFARVDSGEIRLLYVAPERLYKSFIEKILKLKQGVSMLVIDEAHMISEAGSQWRPFYGELKHAWEQFGKPQLLVLTATAGKKIREDIQKQFGIPDEYVFLRSTVREHIRISAENVTNPNMGTSVEDQKARALEFVKRAKGSPVLIYCSWINYIYDLKSYLDDFFIRNMLSVQVEVYHTGPDLFGNVIDSGELHKRHLRFLSNETQVLIATSAYGMGIDKPDIWGVLFNNMPASLEELVQGWGRVCRDPDKLREYLEAKHPPEVSVTYNVKDWRERENQISGNFRTISEWQEDILNTHGIRWHLALNSAAPLEYSCQAGTFFKDSTWAGRDLSRTDVLSSDRLDEDKLCACLLMARYMRENAMLSDFEFDWKSSVFRFKGVSGCPKAEKLEGLLGKCNLEQQKKLDKVEEFCLTKKCRNEFLEEYFAAPRPKSKCMLCDNCRGPVPGAYEGYTEFLHEKADENVRHHFVRGVFGGGDAAFLQYLQGIPEDELSVQTAYLDREHLESGQEHSDAECAAILLELKQDKAEPEKVIQRIVRLVEGDFPRLRDRGREAIFFPFARECGIPQPEELWESISFICGNRETAGPDRVTWRFLAECKDHEKRMNLAGNDPAYREALEKWIVGNAPSELGEFILKSEFRACVYYICRGLALKKLLSENEDDGSWSTLAKYLKKIVKWEKEDKTKFRYLCDLTEHLPAKEKEEWDRILIAPEDYLKMAEADPELFGPEKYWEPEWFCNSVLAGSELARCVDNRENILLSETETAAGRMPMESWRDLLDWMPCTAKLYPAWKEMLEKIREKDLHVQFSDPASVPAEIAAYCTELPPALKDFLKREVFFGNDPKWLEKLSDLSVDAGKTSAKGGRKG